MTTQPNETSSQDEERAETDVPRPDAPPEQRPADEHPDPTNPDSEADAPTDD